MTIAATSVRRNATIIVLCTLLALLFPLSVTAQEDSELEGVMFVNPETEDALVVLVESWDTPGEVKFQMRLYENDNLTEGALGEGYEVINSTPLSEEDATTWDIEGGLELEIDSADDGLVTMYILPVELDVVIVMYMGEAFSDRRLNRFVGDVVEDGLEVRTPRGFERIDDIEDFFE